METGVRPGHGSAPSMPGWVKVFGIITLVLVLVVVILLLAGGGPGGHGPSRHTSSTDAGVLTTISTVSEPGAVGGHIPSAGGDAQS